MGSLTLPSSGPVYLDANGFITDDEGFLQVPGLPVAVLDEAVG